MVNLLLILAIIVSTAYIIWALVTDKPKEDENKDGESD